jgi:hypothetical protein
VKGIRDVMLGHVECGIRCSICRSENISTGAAIAKRMKSSLGYVSDPVGEKPGGESRHLTQNIHASSIAFASDGIICPTCELL